jgi:hypothetical protein
MGKKYGTGKPFWNLKKRRRKRKSSTWVMTLSMPLPRSSHIRNRRIMEASAYLRDLGGESTNLLTRFSVCQAPQNDPCKAIMPRCLMPGFHRFEMRQFTVNLFYAFQAELVAHELLVIRK